MSRPQSTIWPDSAFPGAFVQQWSGDYWDSIAYFPKRYQIGMIDAGKLILVYKEQAFTFEPETVFFIRPGMVHAVQNDGATANSATCVFIEPLQFESLAGDVLTVAFPDTLQWADKQAEKRVSEGFRAYSQQVMQPVAGLDSAALLAEAVGQLMATYDSTEKGAVDETRQAVERAQRYLQTHFREKITLDELADHSFMSKFHLLRLFKDQVGLTPHIYQLHLRLNEARKMLMRGQSLADVAYSLNFTDQAHFIHTFKRYAELSPKKYQHQLRNFLQFLKP